MAIASGSSNYPSNFDLFPTSGTPTLSYVIDQERSPITGLITMSGTKIQGIQVNSVYTILQTIEKTLGLNPQSVFADVNARFNAIAISGVGAGVYVPISGGTMMGYLGTIASGTHNLGEPGVPFANLYVDNIISPNSFQFVHKSGDTMTGDLNLLTQLTRNDGGVLTINNPSGMVSVASHGGQLYMFSDTYVDMVSVGNMSLSAAYGGSSGTMFIGAGASGEIVLNAKNISTSANILPSTSGTLNLGAPTLPYNVVYANMFSGLTFIGTFSGTNAAYVLKAGDIMTGNLVFNNNAIISGSSVTSMTGASGVSLFFNASPSPGQYYDMLTLVDGNTSIVQGQSSVAQLSLTFDSPTQSINLSDSSSTNGYKNLIMSGNNINIINDANGGPTATNIIEAHNTFNYSIITQAVAQTNISTSNPGQGTTLELTPYTALMQASNPGGIASVSVTTIGSTQVSLSGTTINTTGNIIPTSSGIDNVGSLNQPYASIAAVNGYFHTLSGMSPIILESDLVPVASGAQNLGSASRPYNTIYVNNIVPAVNGGGNVSGNYVPISGGTMTGNLNFTDGNVINTSGSLNVTSASILTLSGNITFIDSSLFEVHNINNNGALGINIGGQAIVSVGQGNTAINSAVVTLASGTTLLPNSSGTNNIGSPSRPFNTIYVENIVPAIGGASGNFVHITGDTMTGNLTLSGAGINISNDNSNVVISSYGSYLINGIQNTIITSQQSMTGGQNNLISGATNGFALGLGNVVTANQGFAIGVSGNAIGITSYVEGKYNYSYNEASHAEGINNVASGAAAHAEGNRNVAFGNQSHVEGIGNSTYGDQSHAEGNSVTVHGSQAHGEGNKSTAIGDQSHAEGEQTTSVGHQSHSEGNFTTAHGDQSHSEGNATIASGISSHAEGETTVSYGPQSHAEGVQTLAFGNQAHAEGSQTRAMGDATHTEGSNTVASGQSAHAEGYNGYAIGGASHTEGQNNIASGLSAHAEGTGNLAGGDYSHAEGSNNLAIGQFSHVEGANSLAYGQYSHAEGLATVAWGPNSHAEGNTTIASGNSSHAEGDQNVAGGDYSHAEGMINIAWTIFSHAEGAFNYAGDEFGSGAFAHVEGYQNVAYGTMSHAEGNTNNASGMSSHVEGYGNIVTTNALFSHAEGNGNFIDVPNAHAEGGWNIVSGSQSHAEGSYNVTVGAMSHAEGYSNFAFGDNSHVQGIGNIASGDSSFAGGNSSQANGYTSVALGYAGIANASGSWVFTDGDINNSATNNVPNSLLMNFQSGVSLMSGTNFSVSMINNAIVTKQKFMIEPSGLVNGLNNVFTLPDAPYGNTLMLHKNGLLLIPSGVHSLTSDYILSGNTITFIANPTSGATLIAASYGYLG